MTRVLIVGNGAREHALAWKLAQSRDISALYVAPGNPGTASLAQNVPIAATDIVSIIRFAEERDIDLTVVGPEAPLALGLADGLRARGRRVVGPDAPAARIEWSKSFAKDLMRRAGVPTAEYIVAEDLDDALQTVELAPYPLVLKADGLAAGKGVAICADVEAARDFVLATMVERRFGGAGSRMIIEELLTGPEVSLLALVDGARAVALSLAQDHKRLGEGDTGPNTGGMGAYAPVPFAGDQDALVRLAIEPIVAALADMGTPYRGVLFAGLMLTEAGPRVLEYNCRFGDPEAQVVLPLIEGDMLPWLDAMACGELSGAVPTRPGYALGVVLATPGYPESPQTGSPIEGLENLPDGLTVFHAGTALHATGRMVTAGGRVLTLVGMGETLEEAAQRAYAAPVSFSGMQRRRDIGRQALNPETRQRSVPELVDRQVAIHGPHRAGHRIAVLASGEGSNLQTLIDASAAGTLDAEVALVVSHRVGAGAVQRARRAGIPAVELPLADPGDPIARRQLEEELQRVLDAAGVDAVVLAGWMLVLSAEFLAGCPYPLLNVHPALLPFEGEQLDVPLLRGAHAVRDALRLGLSQTGVSVHYVTPEVDAGPVLARAPVEIMQDDTEESLYRRIKPVEHRLLLETLGHILSVTNTGVVYA